MTTAKRLLAWTCETDEPEDSRIVWAASPNAAMDLFDPEREHRNGRARREPVLDEDAPGPAPYRKLLDLGWYIHCEHCGRRISYDDPDEWIDDVDPAQLAEALLHQARRKADDLKARAADPNRSDRAPFHDDKPMLDRSALRFIGLETVFCNALCQQARQREIAEDEIRAQDDEAAARTLFPFAVSAVAFRLPYTSRKVRIEFGGRSHADWIPGEQHVHVHQDDAPLWKRLRDERDANAAQPQEEK